MKKIKLLSSLLALFFAAMLISSCVDDDFDTPPTDPIAIGTIKTISEIKAQYLDQTITEDISVYATVVMDDKTGNIYKTAYIQDATDAIALHFDASGGLYQGDSIRIQLNGLKVGTYKNLYQIDAPDGNGFTLDSYITKVATLVERTPEVVTISELNTKQAKLIKLENVQFVKGDTSVTYADAVNELSVSLTIEDASGNTAIVRTSGYASFASEITPSGSGSLIAVVGQYNSDMQLQIRSLDEVVMEGDRFGGSTGTAEGTGIFDDPYNVAAGIANQGETSVWVEGYIVGVYETNVDPYVASFASPFATNANMIIADNANETNIANCVIIQLPAGDIRNPLNLVDNSANLGKQVKLLGNLESYFSDEGLKSVTGFWMDGAGVIPESGFYQEDFASDISGFSAFSVTGDQVWGHASYDNGCAKMSGYDGTSNKANEDWMVSPNIDLTGKANVTMVLREAINFGTSNDDVQVLISTDYDGTSTPNTQGTWTPLTGFSRPAGNSWDFASSGDIDISTYDGEATFYIAFKYLSSTSDGATWEIGNVLLKEGAK